MRISDWSSDVCSSDLSRDRLARRVECTLNGRFRRMKNGSSGYLPVESGNRWGTSGRLCICHSHDSADRHRTFPCDECRSEEHTSELQSLMRISYAVFCLKKTKNRTHIYILS